MKDKYDYESFKLLCQSADVVQLTVGEFAQKVGMLAVAIQRYNLSPVESYSELIKEMNEEYKRASEQMTKTPSCGSCNSKKLNDGGKVK